RCARSWGRPPRSAPKRWTTEDLARSGPTLPSERRSSSKTASPFRSADPRARRAKRSCMSRSRTAVLAAFFAASSVAAQTAAPAVRPAVLSPPVTRQESVRETVHGTEISDPYRWLEDQDAPATREWIGEQNRYAEACLSRIAGRDRLARRVADLLKVDVH